MHTTKVMDTVAALDSAAMLVMPRVVVADDDADMRRLVSAALRRRDLEVVELADGNALLRFISQETDTLNEYASAHVVPPLIIVTDVRMPGCDGLTIIDAIRRWGWNVPIVLISASTDPGVMDEADRLDVAAFFHKPFDAKFLAIYIEAMAQAPRHADASAPRAPL